MKRIKLFADGLAVLLAVLLLIYLLTCYMKYDPSEDLLKDKGKIRLFIDNNLSYRIYLYIILTLCFSALVGTVLRKLPYLCVLASVIPLCYVITVFAAGSLSYHPSLIIVFTMFHAVGTVFFAAGEDRNAPGKHYTALGGWLCQLSALALAVFCTVKQFAIASVANQIKEIEDAGIYVAVKLKSFPDLIRRIYTVFLSLGTDAARSMETDFARDIDVEATQMYFLNSLDSEQAGTYLTLSIMLVIICAAWFLLRNRSRRIASLLTLVPPLWLFICLETDKLSTMPLMLMTLTLFAAVCALTDSEEYGKLPVSVTERQMFEEEEAERAAEEEKRKRTQDNTEEEEEEEVYYDL